jgi:hypothetical protein
MRRKVIDGVGYEDLKRDKVNLDTFSSEVRAPTPSEERC